MGFLKRAAQHSQDKFWAAVPLEPCEQRINYAHLLIAFDHADRPGTAFLTDRRFTWVTPSGAVGLDYRLDDCGGWAVPNARPNQPGLVIGFPPTPGAEPAPLLLYPQRPRSPACRHLAQQFFQSVIDQLAKVHPDW